MKREIKFRIWDKFKNVFVPSDIFGIVNTDFGAFAVMIKDWENYKEGEYFYPYQHELMQFTGLHDKNGKEIYEGDIIKNPSASEPEHLGWVVQYINYGFFLNLIIRESYIPETKIPLDFDTIDFKIIGNIYENPELLQP